MMTPGATLSGVQTRVKVLVSTWRQPGGRQAPPLFAESLFCLVGQKTGQDGSPRGLALDTPDLH